MRLDWIFKIILKMVGVLDIIKQSKTLNKLYSEFAINKGNSFYFEPDGQFYIENRVKM